MRRTKGTLSAVTTSKQIRRTARCGSGSVCSVSSAVGIGVGIVGDQRRDVGAGTTLYIPQGTWHGIDPRSAEFDVLWVVSPPNFAENLRPMHAKLARHEKVSPLEQYAIGRRHGIRDYPTVVLARVGVIASFLAVVAAGLVLLNRGHASRTAAIYVVGATLATALTMVAVGRALIPPSVLAISTLLIVGGTVAGALAGIATHSLLRRGRGLEGSAPGGR